MISKIGNGDVTVTVTLENLKINCNYSLHRQFETESWFEAKIRVWSTATKHKPMLHIFLFIITKACFEPITCQYWQLVITN